MPSASCLPSTSHPQAQSLTENDTRPRHFLPVPAIAIDTHVYKVLNNGLIISTTSLAQLLVVSQLSLRQPH